MLKIATNGRQSNAPEQQQQQFCENSTPKGVPRWMAATFTGARTIQRLFKFNAGNNHLLTHSAERGMGQREGMLGQKQRAHFKSACSPPTAYPLSLIHDDGEYKNVEIKREKGKCLCVGVCVCGYVCVLKYASKKAKANGLQSESAASEIRQNEKQNTGYKRQTGGHGRVGVAPSSPAYQNTRTCGVSRTWRFPCLFRCFGSAVYWLSDRQRRYTICKVRWGNRYKAGKRMKYITGGRGQKSSQWKLHSRVLHGKIPFDQFQSTQTIPNNKSLINSYATLYFFLNLR